MQKLNELESNEEKVRNIALKTCTKKNEEPEEEVAESSASENFNLFVKRFGKYLKRKGSKGNPKRYTSKHNESNSSKHKDISKLNVQMLTKKRRRRVLIGKRRKSQRRDVHTLHGRTMMIQQQVAPHNILTIKSLKLGKIGVFFSLVNAYYRLVCYACVFIKLCHCS